LIAFLSDKLWFPPVDQADPDGLLAVGGDLSPQRLLLAYSQGIFPWYEADYPILWWAPFPRPVIFLKDVHLPRRFKRILKKELFTVSFDRCFERVILACARLREAQGEKTWITPEMQQAYIHLHLLGYAHSVEVWQKDKLVGGLYGVSIGRAFFGESMFHLVSNASKVGLWHLICFLRQNKFLFIDCQQKSKHVEMFGAREVDLNTYQKILGKAIKSTNLKNWQHNLTSEKIWEMENC